MAQIHRVGEDLERERGIAAAAKSISAQQLVVLPTDTVYGVGCDAFSPLAVSRLAAARGAPAGTPPPVMVPHARTLDGIATDIPAEIRILAEAFWPGALTLIVPMQRTLSWDLGDSGGTVAVRMPLHPVALELLDRTGPLAVSGASLHGTFAALSFDEAYRQLGEAVTTYLDGGPVPGAGTPSTVVDGTGEVPRVLRTGAISLAELRAVVPAVRGEDETQGEDEVQDEGEGEA